MNKTPKELLKIMCDMKIEEFTSSPSYYPYDGSDYELVEEIRDYAIEITYNYFKKEVNDEVFFKKAYEWLKAKEEERKIERLREIENEQIREEREEYYEKYISFHNGATRANFTNATASTTNYN